MPHRAEGPFDIDTTPMNPNDSTNGTKLNRFSLIKLYHGALEAAAQGEMLTSGSHENGSAGYVAIEEVSGSLDGRKGSFALQHWGTMQAGKFELRVEIVPGSGLDELSGITGKLTIAMDAGKHSYALDYSLPTAN